MDSRERAFRIAEQIASDVLAPQADRIDREASWPEQGVRALLDAGLGGFVVPRRQGGLGYGLAGLTELCELLGRACSSTAMCFGMHCVASAVIAAKANDDQQARFLEPINRGEHLTTLALSEFGSGAHFYFPQTTLERQADGFRLAGQKAFVTNGAHADSYVVSVAGAANESGIGEFSCVLVPAATAGLSWSEGWDGLGMRGNDSRSLDLDGVQVPVGNLLGAEGDELWYVFEVVAPYFLMAMTGVYLGIGQRALEIAVDQLKRRQHGHSASPLAKNEILQHRLGSLWAVQERTRALARYAGQEIDRGNQAALPALLSAKAEVADACVEVVNGVLTLCGGQAYAADSTLGRLLRDARAAHVMAPTTDILKVWIGRSLLGEPLLDVPGG